MTYALVLGGGGPVGIAWQLGVLAGLAEEGCDLAADRVIGTSAGAVVGAQIAAGRPAPELYADHLDLPHRARFDSDIRRLPPPDLTPLMAFFMRRPQGEMPSAALLQEMGRYALGATTLDEDEFVAGIGRLLLTGTDWPARFACTAVDAETGSFKVWDAASGVDLARAVAASCAVPGLYPPITIDRRRYIDGGVRSNLNTDVAGGAGAVLVLAVTLEPVAAFMAAMAKDELGRLGLPEDKALLIVPDAGALRAFGPDLMDGTRHTGVAASGLDQGRREASRLRSLRA